MDLFKGYIPTGGKDGKRPTEDYKNRITFYTLEEVKPLKSYGGVLKDDIIQIDIDDFEQSEIVFKIIEDLNINCHVLKTTRGKHFYFKNTDVDKRKQGWSTPIGVKIDVGLGNQNAVIPLKINDEMREWLLTDDEIDPLPSFLYPVSRTSHVDFSKLEEGDGRNSILFPYILVLQQAGLTKEEIRESIHILNKYIIKEPVTDSELDTILRDEAFKKECFYIKNKLQYEKLARYLISDEYVIKINNSLHIYADGVYNNDLRSIEKTLLRYINNSKSAERTEVIKYLDILAENKFQTTPKTIAVANGLLDIESKHLTVFDPKIIIKNKIAVNYNPSSYNEDMDKTLNKICCNDKQLRLLIEEMIGYCLFRRNELGKCFILTGHGSNGKSTLLDVIKRLLGEDNISSVSLEDLNDRFKTFQLEGKLANIGDDISNKYIDNNSTFKKLVTGETVNVERKGKDPFDFNNYSKLIFSCNDMPRINDLSDGLKRRIILIPFNARFSKSDANFDPFIIDKLMKPEALEYLLNLALAGLERILYNRAFTIPESVSNAWTEYEKTNNPVLGFIEDAKIENELTSDVYLQYQTYCADSGLKHLSKAVFTRELSKLGYKTKQIRINGKRPYIFIK
ncbi:MAG: phage/plasmid primase, P4 family [Terrisporobacter sp.]|uniref:DNA primase family protein n=1 Tax=Terrisporobacter sp. TaxID=1965305 RepID=UPI002A917911|nr:phage/plasmid primase, P4 family [Terrisporobacter sp.]MDY6151803.1 phage/plasmid primase, P4 family [Terrisporobacter sp.]